MIRLQPLSLLTDSADRYRLRCEGQRGIEDYTFTFERTPEFAVLTSDQREFYFATHDDIGADIIQKAIDCFDQARCFSISEQSALVPVCITAEPLSTGDSRYTVRFESPIGEVEHAFAIIDNLPTAQADYLALRKDSRAMAQLNEAISNFH